MNRGRSEQRGIYIAGHGWLVEYRDTYCGRGSVRFSKDRSKALRFGTVHEAVAYWRQQSATVPLGTDGRPNRPLMVYVPEILPVSFDPLVL